MAKIIDWNYALGEKKIHKGSYLYLFNNCVFKKDYLKYFIIISYYFRIYLRLPQWSNIQSMLTLRQMAFFVGAAIVIIVIVTLFTASLMREDDDNTTPASRHFHPAANYGNKEHDLQLFNHGAHVHYGIVLDCGSSGTRVYVYVWPPHSGDPQDLLSIQQLKDNSNQPVVKKVTPGLFLSYLFSLFYQ